MCSTTNGAERVDVLIVGAGPAGLTLSALLARAGTDALTVTRHQRTAHTPRAHVVNQRTMEILRDLGVQRQAQSSGHSFAGELPDVIWATSFAGPEIARVRARGAGPGRLTDYALASPCDTWNVAQHRLEPVLLTAARAAGAEVRFGHEVTEMTAVRDGVRAIVADRETGATREVHARWLIGADGGASTVAELAGFDFQGTMDVRRAINVWVDVDLKTFCDRRPANIYGVHRPGRDPWMGAGLWVCVTPWKEWVVSRFLDADDDLPTEAEASSWLTECVGEDVPVTIRDISTWSVHNAVAASFRAGQILLLGDAAHRHPPVNGLGMNTSIQDAYNLAWKLSLLLRGDAGEALIDTYDAERRPVGVQVVARSWRSARDTEQLGRAIGLVSGQSEIEGEAALAELWAAGEPGRARRVALYEALAQTGYQFNAQGVELGQRYTSSAVADDGWGTVAVARDPELYYEPRAAPGTYLPHAWLEHDHRPLSSLDVPHPCFLTLLIGVDGQRWRAAAEAVAADEGLPLAVRTIGERLEYDDVYGDWRRLCGVQEDGCLLVRPDRHVAWISVAAVSNPSAELSTRIHKILSLATPGGTG